MTCRGVCEVWAICWHPEDLHAPLNTLVTYDLSTFFTLCLIMMLIAPCCSPIGRGHAQQGTGAACLLCMPDALRAGACCNAL